MVPDLVSLINRWPSKWLDSDGPELRWEAALALLKMNYADSNTQKIINNLLTRSYYNSYSELDENTVNFVILKILNILHSIDNKNLLIIFICIFLFFTYYNNFCRMYNLFYFVFNYLISRPIYFPKTPFISLID